MRFDIITIFPKVVEAYTNESILKRAQKKKLVDIRVCDLRAFARNKHNKLDDKPYGGGPGMVIFAEPILRAVQKVAQKKLKSLVIITAARGKQFDAAMAKRLSKERQIIIIAGHYEGIDERVSKILQTTNHKPQTISIGPYVLTGGELPAMIMADAIARQIPGVLGNTGSLEEGRHGVGVSSYTRPEILK